MTIFASDDIERRAVIELSTDIPIGWEDIHLTPEEMNALSDYADAGMIAEAVQVVDGAYARMFGEHAN